MKNEELMHVVNYELVASGYQLTAGKLNPTADPKFTDNGENKPEDAVSGDVDLDIKPARGIHRFRLDEVSTVKLDEDLRRRNAIEARILRVFCTAGRNDATRMFRAKQRAKLLRTARQVKAYGIGLANS